MLFKEDKDELKTPAGKDWPDLKGEKTFRSAATSLPSQRADSSNFQRLRHSTNGRREHETNLSGRAERFGEDLVCRERSGGGKKVFVWNLSQSKKKLSLEINWWQHRLGSWIHIYHNFKLSIFLTLHCWRKSVFLADFQLALELNRMA